MRTKLVSIVGLVLLAVVLLGVNIASNQFLKGARIDLTENRLYTLSAGSRKILKEVDEPIKFTLYRSKAVEVGDPGFDAYMKRVEEMLEEYRSASRGKITLSIIDPEPDSDAETEAQRLGVQGVPVRADAQFYFGLVGENSTDGRETIPFLSPNEEQLLEYKLTKLVYSLDHPDKRVVGIISPLQVNGTEYDPRSGQPPVEPWRIVQEMKSVFDVRMLGQSTDTPQIPGLPPQQAPIEKIDDDVDVLVLIYPKNLPEQTLRAIDAYTTAGRSLVVFLDALCETDQPPNAQQNPLAVLEMERSANLSTLMSAWGVDLDVTQAAVDMALAARGMSPDRRQIVPYIQRINVKADQTNTNDPAMFANPNAIVSFLSAGILTHDEKSTTAFEPLMSTSDQCMIIKKERLKYFATPQELVAEFVPRGSPLTLAARLSGEVRSAFADAESEPTGTINAIVFSDVDLLNDALWTQPIQLGNQVIYNKTAYNGDMVMNVLDAMSGSDDLISVRARGSFARPFTFVQEIQTKAEQQYLAKGQELDEQYRKLNQELTQLIQANPEQVQNTGQILLSPEQQERMANLQTELADIRTQQREVKRNLRVDVERLGRDLKILNIAAAPACVLVIAIFVAMYRSGLRRMDRAKVGKRLQSARG
ncbi:MAG: Gldg family protein [Phycisphaeraceae bacterium]|nr:Gldg family protein [Phycisphaerales bacterium]MCB9860034.1 Gldg family protein [Phycisphaeraceae bacterium]